MSQQVDGATQGGGSTHNQTLTSDGTNIALVTAATGRSGSESVTWSNGELGVSHGNGTEFQAGDTMTFNFASDSSHNPNVGAFSFSGFGSGSSIEYTVTYANGSIVSGFFDPSQTTPWLSPSRQLVLTFQQSVSRIKLGLAPAISNRSMSRVREPSIRLSLSRWRG